MVRSLAAALMLAASASFAAPAALPSFESAALQLQSAVAGLRQAQRKAAAGDVGPRLDRLSWDLRDSADRTDGMRSYLRRVASQLTGRRLAGSAAGWPGRGPWGGGRGPWGPGRGGPWGPGPGRGGPDRGEDPLWGLQRLNQDIAADARVAQRRLQDLGALSAQVAGKDPSLVGPASRLAEAARQFRSETSWLADDARFAADDLDWAGYRYEARDLLRATRQLDAGARDLRTQADALLAKVR